MRKSCLIRESNREHPIYSIEKLKQKITGARWELKQIELDLNDATDPSTIKRLETRKKELENELKNLIRKLDRLEELNN